MFNLVHRYPHQHKCLRCNIFPYKGLNPRPYSKRSAQNVPMTRRKKLGVAHSLTGGCLLMGNPCSLRLLLYQYSTSTSTRTRWCSSKGNNHDIKIPKIRLKLLRRIGTMDPPQQSQNWRWESKNTVPVPSRTAVRGEHPAFALVLELQIAAHPHRHRLFSLGFDTCTYDTTFRHATQRQGPITSIATTITVGKIYACVCVQTHVPARYSYRNSELA